MHEHLHLPLSTETEFRAHAAARGFLALPDPFTGALAVTTDRDTKPGNLLDEHEAPTLRTPRMAA